MKLDQIQVNSYKLSKQLVIWLLVRGAIFGEKTLLSNEARSQSQQLNGQVNNAERQNSAGPRKLNSAIWCSALLILHRAKINNAELDFAEHFET